MNNKNIILSIFNAHVKRIGFWRTFIGGSLMYTTIPFFIFVHVTIILFLYKIILRPFLNLTHIASKNYIILDRYNISNLDLFDRLNCLFCSYANGIILLMNAEIDLVSKTKVSNLNILKKSILCLYIPLQTLFLIIGVLITTIPTTILMKILGLHRGSHKHIIRNLKDIQYASHYKGLIKNIILTYKTIALIASYNLEQIESAWCPIKHIQKKGVILPKHHDNFFDRSNMHNLYNTIRKSGTVSKNLPKF